MGSEETLGGADADLDTVLPALKRRGCNLLITGKVNGAVSMQASRGLFGEPGGGRLRLCGLTRQAAMKPNEWLPADGERGDDDVRLIEFADCDRFTEADGAGKDLEAQIEPVLERLDAALEELAAPVDPDPAQLRVGIYSLTPLVGRFELPAVKTLLDRFTGIVGGYQGMGHYHLPREDSAAIVEELDPMFDVRIELRQVQAVDPTPEQRWHVDGRTTEWIEL